MRMFLQEVMVITSNPQVIVLCGFTRDLTLFLHTMKKKQSCHHSVLSVSSSGKYTCMNSLKYQCFVSWKWTDDGGDHDWNMLECSLTIFLTIICAYCWISF